MVFNPMDTIERTDTEALFEGEAYAQCQTMTHKLYSKDHGKLVTRTFLQAHLFKHLLPPHDNTPSVLDIGCFDGELLTEIHKLYPKANLHGYDVNKHLASRFPNGEQFHFWASGLEDIDHTFDIISISGSLVYIPDLDHLLTQVKRLLKPKGLVFVQTVDMSKSAYAILLGDQQTHYTSQILNNLFLQFGFAWTPLESSWAPKEITGIARQMPNVKSESILPDANIFQSINELEKVAQKTKSLTNKPVAVLGTSAAAAFVHSVIPAHLLFFVDENTDRLGTFRDQDVRHPSELEDHHHVLLPYGNAAQQIKKRFETQYKGQFICL
jgi:ubiquinone/menaquinone biosynthesis C-methylase UbiE